MQSKTTTVEQLKIQQINVAIHLNGKRYKGHTIKLKDKKEVNTSFLIGKFVNCVNVCGFEDEEVFKKNSHSLSFKIKGYKHHYEISDEEINKSIELFDDERLYSETKKTEKTDTLVDEKKVIKDVLIIDETPIKWGEQMTTDKDKKDKKGKKGKKEEKNEKEKNVIATPAIVKSTISKPAIVSPVVVSSPKTVTPQMVASKPVTPAPNQAAELKTVLDSNLPENNSSKIENQILIKENSDLKDQVSQLKTENLDLKNQINELTSKFSKLDKDNSELQEKFKKSNEVDGLKNENAILKLKHEIEILTLKLEYASKK